jgi:hypothetical protein
MLVQPARRAEGAGSDHAGRRSWPRAAALHASRAPSPPAARGSAHAPPPRPGERPGRGRAPPTRRRRRRSPAPIPTCPRTGRSSCVCRRRARGLAIYPRVRRSSASSPDTGLARSGVTLVERRAWTAYRRASACRPSSASRIPRVVEACATRAGFAISSGRTIRRLCCRIRRSGEVFEHLPDGTPAAPRLRIAGRPGVALQTDERRRSRLGRLVVGEDGFGLLAGRPAGSLRQRAIVDPASAVTNGLGSRRPSAMRDPEARRRMGGRRSRRSAPFAVVRALGSKPRPRR